MNPSRVILALSAILATSAANAQVPAAEWEQFKEQFSVMSERVKALELENQQLREVSKKTIKVEDLAATNAEIKTLKQQNSESSWAERVAWKGDYRFRFEEIHQEDRDDRERYRIRARPALIAKLHNNTEVGFGLATGSQDPVSANQTLGDGGTSKEINLDLAYAKWTGLEGFSIVGGKFVNPYYTVEKSQMIFDSDFRPEGIAATWANDRFFSDVTFAFIDSDSSNTGKNNYGVWSGQVGTVLTPFESGKLTLSAGYIDAPVKGQPAIFNDNFFGNSFVVVEGVDVYEYDYSLLTSSIALGVSAFDLPLSFYVDYVENQDANDLETGYLAGWKLGNAKKEGEWQVQYQYQKLEANATLGVVTNSNFAGGGTDGKGSLLTAKYAIDDQWYVAGAYFFDNKEGMDLGDNANYERFQLDTGYTY